MIHKDILLRLPLATHIKNVILTLDCLDMKLAHMSDMRSALNDAEIDSLMLLSQRFADQKLRLDHAIKMSASRPAKPKRDVQ